MNTLFTIAASRFFCPFLLRIDPKDIEASNAYLSPVYDENIQSFVDKMNEINKASSKVRVVWRINLKNLDIIGCIYLAYF